MDQSYAKSSACRKHHSINLKCADDMTRFNIHRTFNKRYRFTFNFDTRHSPEILYGNLHDNISDCRTGIAHLKKSISCGRNISFAANKEGYRFIVYTPEAKPIAFSRFFPTQELMKRILSIVQNYLSKDMTPVTSEFQKEVTNS